MSRHKKTFKAIYGSMAIKDIFESINPSNYIFSKIMKQLRFTQKNYKTLSKIKRSTQLDGAEEKATQIWKRLMNG